MAKTSKIINTVRETIKNHRLFQPGDFILIGLSGGPDSVALLTILHQINQLDRQRWSFHLAYLNHQIRKTEARRDEEFVRKLGRKFGCPVTIKRAPVPKLARQKKLTLEEAARQARYGFFRQLARSLKINQITVGHHLDDQVETVLFRIIRGCGLRGLGGIRPVRQLFTGSRVELVRPLIEVSRDEIMAFLKKVGMPFRRDRTNRDTKFMRNRIRLKLIPYLTSYNPQIKKNLAHLARIAQATNNYVDKAVKRIRIQKIKRSGNIVLKISPLKNLHPVLQINLIEEALRAAGGPLKSVTAEHYQSVLSLIRKKGSGKEAVFPGWFRVKKEYDFLKFYQAGKKIRRPKTARVRLKSPGSTVLAGYKLRCVATVIKNKVGYLKAFKKNKTRSEEIFDLARLKKPLTLRYPRPGDKFRPLGVSGSQSLKKFFIDHKVPLAKRAVTPLILAEDRITWVVGHRIDERVKVTIRTKTLLKINITPD